MDSKGGRPSRIMTWLFGVIGPLVFAGVGSWSALDFIIHPESGPPPSEFNVMASALLGLNALVLAGIALRGPSTIGMRAVLAGMLAVGWAILLPLTVVPLVMFVGAAAAASLVAVVCLMPPLQAVYLWQWRRHLLRDLTLERDRIPIALLVGAGGIAILVFLIGGQMVYSSHAEGLIERLESPDPRVADAAASEVEAWPWLLPYWRLHRAWRQAKDAEIKDRIDGLSRTVWRCSARYRFG